MPLEGDHGSRAAGATERRIDVDALRQAASSWLADKAEQWRQANGYGGGGGGGGGRGVDSAENSRDTDGGYSEYESLMDPNLYYVPASR